MLVHEIFNVMESLVTLGETESVLDSDSDRVRRRVRDGVGVRVTGGAFVGVSSSVGLLDVDGSGGIVREVSVTDRFNECDAEREWLALGSLLLE